MEIRLKVGELLARRNITPNRLAQKQGLTRNTVYALANPPRGRVRVDLDVLAAAMAAIERESGEAVTLTDVLEVVNEPPESEEERQSRERALSLLTGSPWGKKPLGSDPPGEVSGPPIEEVLREHRGPEL